MLFLRVLARDFDPYSKNLRKLILNPCSRDMNSSAAAVPVKTKIANNIKTWRNTVLKLRDRPVPINECRTP